MEDFPEVRLPGQQRALASEFTHIHPGDPRFRNSLGFWVQGHMLAHLSGRYVKRARASTMSLDPSVQEPHGAGMAILLNSSKMT